MIQRLLANRWPVIAVLSDESVTKWEARALDLQSEQWELLEELACPLELYSSACMEFNVSCSFMYTILDGIITNLSASDENVPIFRQFKESCGSRTQVSLVV